MTLQPSVLIWTVICFCLLMLILNKMLFKPLLAVMDARQTRIEQAREKQRAHAEACDAALRSLEERQAEDDKRRALEAATAVEQAREEAAAQIAEAQKTCELEIVAYRESLIQESHELKIKLDAGVDELAVTYASRLAS